MIMVWFWPLPSILESMNASSMDTMLAEYAFKALVQCHTGIICEVPLPENFSGIQTYAVRLRTRSFWSRGFVTRDIHIPPGVITIPHVRRQALVYQNLANRSSLPCNVPGYTFVAPVIGFIVYDATNLSASNLTQLSIKVTKYPIFVNFSSFTSWRSLHSTVKCVWFDIRGSVHLSNMVDSNICSSKGQGHFSLVTPSVLQSPSPSPSTPSVPQSSLKALKVGVASGLLSLFLLGAIGLVLLRLLVKKNWNLEMEKQAEQEEALGSVWVERSKMPLAMGTRTAPTIGDSY